MLKVSRDEESDDKVIQIVGKIKSLHNVLVT